MKKLTVLTRLTLFIVLSLILFVFVTGTMYSIATNFTYSRDYLSALLLIGLTPLILIVCTTVFGFFALSFSKLNPYPSTGRFILIPFFIALVGVYWQRVSMASRHILYELDHKSIPMLCFLFILTYLYIKLFRMLNHNTHTSRFEIVPTRLIRIREMYV